MFLLWAGAEVSLEEIEATVSVVIEENMNAILEQRYRINGNIFMFTFEYYFLEAWHFKKYILFVQVLKIITIS